MNRYRVYWYSTESCICCYIFWCILYLHLCFLYVLESGIICVLKAGLRCVREFVFSFQVLFCFLCITFIMRNQAIQEMEKLWCNFFFPFFLSGLPLWVWDQKHPPKSWWIYCLKENCMGRILLWLHVINNFWVSLKCSQGKVSLSHVLSCENRSLFWR